MEIDHLLTALMQNEELFESVQSTLPESQRGGLFDAVAMKLRDRFEQAGSTDDIDRAITMEEHAVASTPDDHPDRGIYFNNLGIALQSRFEWTGSMEDLNRAIKSKEQAVEIHPR